MTETEVIEIVREHFKSLFPRDCPNCRRHFKTLRDYILATTRIGKTRSYDADTGDWHTKEPIGTVAAANCPCGNTLTLTTDGMKMENRLKLLNWVRIETQQRGIGASELLDKIRDTVRQQILAENP